MRTVMEYFKTRHGFKLEFIFDQPYLLAAGSLRRTFPAVTPLNETAAFIWTCLSNGKNVECTAEEIALRYNAEKEQVLRDALMFCRDLADKGYLIRQEAQNDD